LVIDNQLITIKIDLNPQQGNQNEDLETVVWDDTVRAWKLDKKI
jgi:hypothetical protein